MSELFRNPQGALIEMALFLVLLISASATRCRAADLTLEGGRAVIHGETPAVSLSLDFGHQKNVGVDHQDFNYECGLLLIGANGRNAHQIAASCQVIGGFGKFDLGFGLAALQNEDQWSSGRLNFALLARYRFTRRVSLTWRHLSNAGTRSPNVGRDVLLIGYQF